MGLFGNNYSRPGKGISKEEAAKRNYFDILGRKFWKIVQVNMLYVLVNILFFGAFVFMILPVIFTSDEAVLNEIMNSLIIPVVTGKTLIPIGYFIPFCFIGPATAGLTYVLRNYAKQEHAFMASDFFEHTKKNLKQGLLASTIMTAVTYLFITAVIFYLNHVAFKALIVAVAVIVGAILICASFYVYPIMVTFDMKLRYIFKNSLIFALAKLPQNVFIMLVILAVHALLIWYLPLVWALLMCVFLIGWSSYTMNYYAWHVINKHMMSQIENNEEKEESVFDDNLVEKK
ncbi:MAG: DUF624 domain-containing protein [Clostridia bacterium]|nr:DUF624 domain-containing protein [Clostridia bacterium]